MKNLNKKVMTGLEIIAEERKRQIEVKGYTVELDDRHEIGDLANASSCYAMVPELRPAKVPPVHRPWFEWWRPTNSL